jgi:hypothetical protein
LEQAKGELKKIAAERKAAEEAELAKRGEFEKLAADKAKEAEEAKAELEKQKKLTEELAKQFRKGIEEMKARLPDSLKALYPFGERLSEEELTKAYEWLTKAVRVDPKGAPAVGPGPKPSGGPGAIPDEVIRREMRRYGRNF